MLAVVRPGRWTRLGPAGLAVGLALAGAGFAHGPEVPPEVLALYRQALAGEPALGAALARGSYRRIPLGDGREGILLLPAWERPRLLVRGRDGLRLAPWGPARARVQLAVELAPAGPGQVEASLAAVLEPCACGGAAREAWPREVVVAGPADLPAPGDDQGRPLGRLVRTADPEVFRIVLDHGYAGALRFSWRRILLAAEAGPYELRSQAPRPLTVGAPEPPDVTLRILPGVAAVPIGFASPSPAGAGKGFLFLPGPAAPVDPGRDLPVAGVGPGYGEAAALARRIFARGRAELGEPALGGALVLTRGAGSGGATFGGVALVELVSPGSPGPGEKATLAHELAHLFVDGVEAGPRPDSLHEGLANLFALRWLVAVGEAEAARELRSMLAGTLLGGAPRGAPAGRGGRAEASAYAYQAAVLLRELGVVGEERFLAGLREALRRGRLDIPRLAEALAATGSSEAGARLAAGLGVEVDPAARGRAALELFR